MSLSSFTSRRAPRADPRSLGRHPEPGAVRMQRVDVRNPQAFEWLPHAGGIRDGGDYQAAAYR